MAALHAAKRLRQTSAGGSYSGIGPFSSGSNSGGDRPRAFNNASASSFFTGEAGGPTDWTSSSGKGNRGIGSSSAGGSRGMGTVSSGAAGGCSTAGHAPGHAEQGGAAETGAWVCSLIESRAREVGLASMHRRSLEFELTQFSDCGSYSRTIAAVLALEPAAILVSRTARGTQLLEILGTALEQAGLPEPTMINRQYFDETAGQKLLEDVDVIGLQPSEYSAKFVACAAFNALWHFAESSMESCLQVAAVRVTFRGAADTMIIDTNTSKLLELVADAREHREHASMFGLFNCRTPGGGRLLRQSLLQPPACKAEIEARQTAVGALLSNEHLFYELQRLLPAVGDVDLLAARLAAEPKTRGPQWCKAAVRTAVRLRHALAALPLIADPLRCRSAPEASGDRSDGHSSDGHCQDSVPALFSEAREVLKNARFPALLEELDRVLDTSGPPAVQGQGSLAHAALMYAVRPGVNALLDIARQTWNEALEQVHSIHRAYATKYPELNVKLEFTERRGWYVSHTSQMSTPPEFLRTAQKGTSGRQMSTTRELNTENFKLRQAEREILTQTLVILNGLFGVLRREAPLLYQVAHTASMLDLIQAFVGYALLLGECTRPELTDDPLAPIAIKAGRHPLMERLLMSSDAGNTSRFEPLDFFVSEACHFQVVTGANGGGKSTYLKTMAQLVVLAQIGCFLPARYAAMRIVSSLFTRIGTSDSLEASASTFFVEMQEAAHILSDVSPDSLVLIDELGRGTAHADGVALCWAICERLLELRVYTFFATHFFEVCRLQQLFPGLRNMHLEEAGDSEQPTTNGERQQRRHFTVRHITSLEALLKKPQSHYGLRAAEQAGLPKALMGNAYGMAAKAAKLLALHLPNGPAAGSAPTAASVLQSAGGAEMTSATAALGMDEAAQKEATRDIAQRLLSIAGGTTLGPGALSALLKQMQQHWANVSSNSTVRPPIAPPGGLAAAGA